MYASYWGLRREPFQNVLDDSWFFESTIHEEAVARMRYLVEQRRTCGVVAGPEGTGKSLVLKHLANALRRSQHNVAEADLASVDSHEMIWRLLARLRLGPRRGDGPARMWRTLEDYLAGSSLSRRPTVFLLDHADQSYPECGPVFERLLGSAQRAPGGITILAAMRDPHSIVCESLVRLSDLRIEIRPLDARQTARFVADALQKAGCQREVFPPRAMAAVYEESRGVPRVVNRLCELSLLAAMSESRDVVDPHVVHNVAPELHP